MFGLRPSDLALRLSDGDSAFLAGVDPSKAKEALNAGQGAAYYLSFHAEAAGNISLAESLLLAEWDSGTSMYKKEAGKLLIRRFSARENWEHALPFLETFATQYPEEQEGMKTLFRALVETGRESSAAELVKRLDTQGRITDPELEYYEIRSLAAMNEGSWRDRALKLALSPDSPASSGKIAEYMISSESRSLGFTPRQRIFLGIRSLVAKKDYRLAMLLAERERETVFSADAPEVILADAGKAWLYGGGAKSGLALFDALEKSADGKRAFVVSFYRARFLRELKRYGEALAAFDSALSKAPDEEQRDAVLWYLFDTASNLGIGETIRQAERYAPLMAEPSWFSDIFDRLCVECSARSDFKSIDALRSCLKDYATPQIQAQYAYVSGRAAELGYIRGGKETARVRYGEAMREDSASVYYKLLAAARLGERVLPLAGASTPDTRPRAEEIETKRFVEGFFEWGLGGIAYAETLPRLGKLSPETLASFARTAAENGFHPDSIRFASRMSEAEGYSPSAQYVRILYPRPFAKELAAAAGESGIAEHVLFGLSRTESAFDGAVVSRAGAVGLTQLMPDTAKQVAERHGMGDWSAANPSDNALIGARYLAQLKARFGGNLLLAFLAYNGGPTRVARWLADSKNLPADLLLEAVPLDETRQYGRKVLAAAAYYGYLYYGLEPEATARRIIGF